MTTTYESKRCRCENTCANVPERPDGRIWSGLVTRDNEGRIHGLVYANESAFDGACYLPAMKEPGWRFTEAEWLAMEPV